MADTRPAAPLPVKARMANTTGRGGRSSVHIVVWLTLIGAAGLASGALAADPADTVFVNGKVFTADDYQPSAQAFAVKGGRFVAVGSSQAMRAHIGSGTKVVDLHGRLVTPGLADGHFHNEGDGPGIDLSGARTLADLFATVAEAAKKAQPGDVIVSNADWHEAQLKEKRLPHAKELTAAAPNNPVVLVRGGHEMILNTVALEKWGITKGTVTPDGGEIGHDPDGAPNGELTDNAKNLVTLPPRKPVTVEDVLATQRKLNAYGITAVRIPGSYKGELFSDYKLIKQVKDSGRLSLRYVVLLPGFGTRDPARIRQMITGSGLSQDEGDDWLRIGGVKLLVDGGFEGGHMREPYAEPYGKGGKFTGITVVPPANFTAVVKEVNKMGWRVTTHAVGDAALDEVLDAYEAANAEYPIAGHRWAIEHLFIVRPDQIARMKKLGVMLAVQDHLYLAAPAMRKYWGVARASQVVPLKTLLDNGFMVAGGTDSSVVPFNPFWEIYHFNTRDTIADGVYGPGQAVKSRQTLVRMITINYATLIGEDAVKGSITPGKLADFAVLSDDIFRVPAKRLLTTKALATYVDGKEVYRDPNFK